MFAGTWRTEPPADRQPKESRSDQCLTFNDPLWPIQWELVSVTANVCVFYGSASSPLLRATNVPMVKDAPLTGISQAHFRVWLVRDGRWREVGWLQRARERGGGGGERLTVLNWDKCQGLMMLWATHRLMCELSCKTSSFLLVLFVCPMHVCEGQQHYQIIF